MIDLINSAATSNSTTNARRPEGQPETPQANIRQEPQAQRPQVQPPSSPQQTQQAVNQTGANDGVALLNNREQAAANAIQQRPQQASAQQIQVDSEPVVQQQGRQSTEAAIENSIRVNTQQQPASPQAAQQLADTAQSALANIRQAQQQRPDPEPVAERVQRQAEQTQNNQPRDAALVSGTPDTTETVQNANEQTFETRPPVQAGAGQAPQAETPVTAPGAANVGGPQQQTADPVQVQQQQAEFQQAEEAARAQEQAQQQPVREPVQQQAEAAPQPAQQPVGPQVGFGADESAQTQAQPAFSALDPQATVGDILRPDFNQFVGLRASVPASAQEPQTNETQGENNDNQGREPVDFEA